jgi:tellurite resistance protein
MAENLEGRIAATPGNLWLLNEHYAIARDIPLGLDYDAYFKGMMVCAAGDGELSQQEKDWVIGYAHALGAPPSTMEELKQIDANDKFDIAELLKKSEAAHQSRRFMVYYAIMACSSDGEYNESEKKAVMKLADTLGIKEDRVKQIENMVEEDRTLREKRLEILYPEGPPY